MLKRIGFYILAFIIAFAVSRSISLSDGWVVALSPERNDFLIDIFALTYFSLLLLFPRRTDGLASATGLVAIFIGVVASPWQITFVCGGIVSFVLHLFIQRRAHAGACINLLFIVFLLDYISGEVRGDIFAMVPQWYFFVLIGLILFGYIVHNNNLKLKKAEAERQTVEHYNVIQGNMNGQSTPNQTKRGKGPSVSPKTQNAQRVNKEQTLANNSSKTKTASTAAAKEADKYGQHDAAPTSEQLMESHKKVVLHLLQQGHKLPEDMAANVIQICEYTKLILNSMVTDPRDFAPGDKFLSRYLNGTKTIVDNCVALSVRTKSTPKLDEILAQSKITLEGLADAFVEQHHRLLENDAIDLATEAGVLERLLRMEGFK